MIIGITGTIASGKGKIADYIKEKYGFSHHSFSMAIRKEAQKRGIKITRQSLHRLGALLIKQSKKKSILGQRIIDRIKRDMKKGIKNFVVEGIRDTLEIRDLREFGEKNSKIIIMGVDAEQKTRFIRLKKRGRKGDPKTFAEFKKIDDHESSSKGGQQVGECLKMADFIIDNSGTLEQAFKQTDRIMKKISANKK